MGWSPSLESVLLYILGRSHYFHQDDPVHSSLPVHTLYGKCECCRGAGHCHTAPLGSTFLALSSHLACWRHTWAVSSCIPGPWLMISSLSEAVRCSNMYLRMSWELFLFPCVIATLSLGKGRGTQPMRRRVCPLGLPEDSPPSLYFWLEYSASLDSYGTGDGESNVSCLCGCFYSFCSWM